MAVDSAEASVLPTKSLDDVMSALAGPPPYWAEPAAIRYIKLGAGGGWEQEALTGGMLLWGNALDPHEAAAAGDWDAVRETYRARGLAPGTVTSYVREARDFYTAGPDTLWITFASGHLWWAFAEPEVTMRPAATGATAPRVSRRVISQWRNTDLAGRPLAIADLSTALTRTAAYQQTICNVDAEDYLKRVINGEANPAALAVKQARADLTAAVLPLIQQLHQNDFELFVDVLFAAMGWRRVSALGGTMKAIDLLVELPATGARAAVQVKSAASQAVVNACAKAFWDGLPGDRFFIVTHSAKGQLRQPVNGTDARPVMLLQGPELAAAAVRNGLTEWLLQHAA